MINLSRLERCPAALWQPPINAFEQHRQLRSAQGNLALFRRRPHEPPLLQPLAEQAGTLSVPPDDLDEISAPTTEDKQMAGERILLQRLFGLRCQRRESAPHVGHTSGKPDTRVRWNRYHTERPRMSRASASGS